MLTECSLNVLAVVQLGCDFCPYWVHDCCDSQAAAILSLPEGYQIPTLTPPPESTCSDENKLVLPTWAV
jgi:hypothetical protein